MRSDAAKGFEVLPTNWVVFERDVDAWLGAIAGWQRIFENLSRNAACISSKLAIYPPSCANGALFKMKNFPDRT